MPCTRLGPYTAAAAAWKYDVAGGRGGGSFVYIIYIEFHGRLSPAIVFTEFDLRSELSTLSLLGLSKIRRHVCVRRSAMPRPSSKI